jgi:hypothetical protein
VIKLKDILSEIEVKSGYYTEFKSEDIFTFLPKKVVDAYIRLTRRVPLKKQKTKQDIQKSIESLKSVFINGGKVVWTDGTKNMIEYIGDDSTDILFVLLDFNQLNPQSTDKVSAKDDFILGWLYAKDVSAIDDLHIHPEKLISLQRVLRVHGSFINKKYRGEGYGKLIYDVVLNNIDALVSDSVLYDASFGLWTNYLHNNKKFFGYLYQFGKTICVLPIPKNKKFSKDDIPQSDYGADISGFIVMNKKIPSELQRMKDTIGGVTPSEINIIDASGKFTKSLQDKFDEAVSMDDIINVLQDTKRNPWWSGEYGSTKNPKVLFHFSNALVFAKEVGESIEWTLI